MWARVEPGVHIAAMCTKNRHVFDDLRTRSLPHRGRELVSVDSMGGNERMRADRKNRVLWHAALCAVLAVTGCASQESDEGTLAEGTFAVTSVDLGSCAQDTWVKSQTTAASVLVEANGDAYTLKSCGADGACSPMSPSSFAWSTDAWRGQDGGAYLVEAGCLLVYIDATARIVDNQLVIETSRWSSELASGSCTYDEVIAMRENACDDRMRLMATIE